MYAFEMFIKESAKKIAAVVGIKALCEGMKVFFGTTIQKNVAKATHKKSNDAIPLLCKGLCSAFFVAVSTLCIMLIEAPA